MWLLSLSLFLFLFSLGGGELVVDFEGAESAIDGVKEGVASSAGAAPVDGDDDDVVVRRQIMLPIQFPLVRHFLRPGTVVHLEQGRILQNLRREK